MKIKIFNVFSMSLLVLMGLLLLVQGYVSFGLNQQKVIKSDYNEVTQDSMSEEMNQGDNLLSSSLFIREITFDSLEMEKINNYPYVYLIIDRMNIQKLTVYMNGKILSQVMTESMYNTVLTQSNIIVPIDPNLLQQLTPIEVEIEAMSSVANEVPIYIITPQTLKKVMRMDELALLLKRFFIFTSFTIALFFIIFNKVIIEGINRPRALSFYAASIGLIVFDLYASVAQFNIGSMMGILKLQYTEDIIFLVAISILTYALYIRIADRLVLRLFIMQTLFVVGGILIGLALHELALIISLLKYASLLISAGIGFIYLNYPQLEKHFSHRIYMLWIIIFLIFGQLFSTFNAYNHLAPKHMVDVIIMILPISIASYAILKTIFKEFLTIQVNSELEHKKLVSLNTNIYEYVSEGVFSITQNLLVNELYTKVCHKIFGKDLSGENVADLLYDAETDPAFIRRLLTDYFENKIPWNACKELMPQEITLKNHSYELHYQVINSLESQKEIVVRLTEISERKELEESLAFERDKLALSITSLMNRDELVPLVKEFIEYMQFTQFINQEQVYRLNTIHTFKGNFGVFSFIHVIKALHDLESKMIHDDSIDEVDLKSVLDELYKDLEIISEITGSSFFEDTLYLKANINNLEDVYGEVKKYFYDTEASLIIYIIKKIFNKSLKDIILFYARESRKKAAEDNREIKTIEVTGDDVFLDYQYYRHALRSLVHIFNNCIDHGIEDEEERLILGKPRAGEIQCRISDYGNFVEIMIKDDGRGIDVEKLAELLIREKIISEDQLAELTEEEIIEYVFWGEVSTLEEASLTSGRGVGLASVKREVENVGGEIRITSYADFGTEVKILIPKENDTLISYFSLPLLMDLYVEAFKIYIKSNNIFELPLNVVGSEKIIELYEYNVKIRFEGPETGYFFFSCNKDVLWKFACYLADDINLTEEMFVDMDEEAIKETCNIIAGNSTSVFDLNQKYIFIASPESIKKEYFEQQSLIYKWHMKYGEYGAVLGLILD